VLRALSAATEAGTGGGGARTVVIATHDPFVLDHADEVLAL
jgi:ABC-type lipoprotein export system ATPase subunit